MAEHNGCATKDDVQDLRDRVRSLEEHAVRRTELSALLERVERLDERTGQTLTAVQEVRADLRELAAREAGREEERRKNQKAGQLAEAAGSDPRKLLILLLGAIAVAGAAGGGGSELIQALIRTLGGAP